MDEGAGHAHLAVIKKFRCIPHGAVEKLYLVNFHQENEWGLF